MGMCVVEEKEGGEEDGEEEEKGAVLEVHCKICDGDCGCGCDCNIEVYGADLE